MGEEKSGYCRVSTRRNEKDDDGHLVYSTFRKKNNDIVWLDG